MSFSSEKWAASFVTFILKNMAGVGEEQLLVSFFMKALTLQEVSMMFYEQLIILAIYYLWLMMIVSKYG